MRELAILTFQTLDGVMQAPGMPDEDRSGGFECGGWAAPYWSQVMEQVQKEAMAEPYDMLFGRKTYELFAPNFSNAGNDSPVARLMNNAKKYVVSNTLTTLEWQNSELIAGDIPAEIASLKAQDGHLLQIHGSCELIQTLLQQDMIDEFRLWTFPVMVGDGKRLFCKGIPPNRLTLTKTEMTRDGVVMAIYRREA